MQADVLGVPVLLPDAPEASGWGAAICAGVGVGWWPNVGAAPRDRVPPTPVAPRAAESETYDRLYRAWLADEVGVGVGASAAG